MKLVVNKPRELAEFAGYVLLFVLGPLLIVQWEFPRLGVVAILIGAWLQRWCTVARYEIRIDKLEGDNERLERERDTARSLNKINRARADQAEATLRELAQVREQFARSSIN